MNKFLKGIFLLSARQKLRFLSGRCDTSLTKERSIPVRTRKHVLSLTGYDGEKLCVDLVSMLNTMRGNQYLLTSEDSFNRYCHVYLILNKEVHTVAKMLMDRHFNFFGLQNQLHSDNRKEFVNNLWRELYSEFKIQRTTTLPFIRLPTL